MGFVSLSLLLKMKETQKPLTINKKKNKCGHLLCLTLQLINQFTKRFHDAVWCYCKHQKSLGIDIY